MKNINSKALKKLLIIHVAMAGLALLMLSYKWASDTLSVGLFRLPYCLTHDLFHLYCPLCGGTRSVLALLRLDIVSALKFNPLAVAFAAGFVIYDGLSLYRILKGRDLPEIKFGWGTVAVVIIGYFVIRNLLMIIFGIDPIGELLHYWK